LLLDRGLGVGFPDVDDIGGPTATGGTFDLTYDAKTEFHVMGTLGTTYHFTSIWAVTLAARVEHHFKVGLSQQFFEYASDARIVGLD
jgi:hypothetical protein